MKASFIQTQIGLNAQVLTGLYEEIANLRKSRKMYNECADECFVQMMIADDELDFDKSHQHNTEGEANLEQAAVFTPYIKKFAKRIKAIEQVQKSLKQELKFVQYMEAWNVEEDAFWLEQASVAAEEGFVEPTVVNKFLQDFEEF
jgi:hypothetical protein